MGFCINLIEGTFIDNQGMKPKDLKLSIALVNENKVMFLKKWNLNFYK